MSSICHQQYIRRAQSVDQPKQQDVIRRRCGNRRIANVAAAASRREVFGGAAVALSAQLLVQQADAAATNLEPMEALKGKDYGKPRMT